MVAACRDENRCSSAGEMLTFFLNTDPVDENQNQFRLEGGGIGGLTLRSLQEGDTGRVHRLVDRGGSGLRSDERLSVRVELRRLSDSVGVVLGDESSGTELDEVERHEPDLRKKK